jgi:ABC-type transport system involved in multi-copper enzyme maturation permease subunit
VINLLKSEIFRVRKRPQAWIMIWMLVLLQVGLYSGLVIASFVRDDPASVHRNIQIDNLWETGLIPTIILPGIMLIVFGSSLMGNEYGWNTIRPLIARAPNRISLLAAKISTLILYALLLAAAGVITAVLGSVIGSAIVGIDSGLSADRLVDIVATIGRIGIAALPYAMLAFMLAVITRSNVAGIAIAIALSFLEDALWGLLSLLTDFADTLRDWAPASNVNRIVFYGSESDVDASDLARSIAIVVAYTVVFAVIAIRAFTKRDVTTG